MKKLTTSLITFSVAIICFLLSWIFFMNSGLLYDNYEVNEIRTVEIIRALDEIPFMNFGDGEVNFYSHGEVVEINGNSFVVEEYNGEQKSFVYDNISDLGVDDEVFVYYNYDEDFNKNIFSVKKYLQAKDVKDFDSCKEYGGDVFIDGETFLQSCVIGQVTFVQSLDELGNYCTTNGGTWLEEFRECEYLSVNDCYEMNGKYFECESACRNDPDAEMCVMMCVQVCKFDYGEVESFEDCVNNWGDVYNEPIQTKFDEDEPVRICENGNVRFVQTLEDLEEYCVSRNGVWLEESNECNNLSEKDCEAIGGSFETYCFGDEVCETNCWINP